MGLFDMYRIDLAAAEATLGRRLQGDPTTGEIGVLCALAAGRLGEARRLLVEPGVSADFRSLVRFRLAAASDFACGVSLPGDVLSSYRAVAEREGRSVSTVLAETLTRVAPRSG